MSLFQCEACGCRENTATSGYWFREKEGNPCAGRKLCSACDPSIGQWHGQFERVFLPKGEFRTNARGNLEHIATGNENVRDFAITQVAP